METSVKNLFTKAIAICGDAPVYENVKDFMQDMIEYNVSLASKETPVHLLKFIQTAAYNQWFSDDFRKCMADVLFQREIEDKATMFHIRKLIVLNNQKDERIRELEGKEHIKIDYEQYQVVMTEMKSKGMVGSGDECNRLNETERTQKDIENDNRIRDLEELVTELEMRVEKLREINDKLHEKVDELN